MVQLEPWFIVVIAGMGGLIFLLICIIIVLCTLWRRKNQRRKEEASKQQQMANKEQLVETQSLSFLDLYEGNKSNWVLQERASDDIYSPGSLTRPTATGEEPFIAGTSLVKYSHQLNTREPSFPQAFGTRQQRTSQTWDKGGLVAQSHFNETPTRAEEKMVRLGMIPPRPLEVNGQVRSFSDASSLQRPSSKAKNWKRKSKELEGEKIYNGQVSSSGSEVWLWPGAMSQAPFPLPEEDYNTESLTWYTTAPNGQTSHSSYTPPAHYAKYGPSQNVSVTVESHSVGKIEMASTPAKGSTVADVEQQSPWKGNEITTESKKQKLNRVKRIGVPILPD